MSICIPTYNRAGYVVRAIESALREATSEDEVLVVDNASADNTEELLHPYRRYEIFRYVRNAANLGMCGNWNRCLALSVGRFVKVLSSDDRLLNGALQREVSALERTRSAVMVTTLSRRIGEDGSPVRQDPLRWPAGQFEGISAIRDALWTLGFLGFNPFTYPSGILFRRVAALQVGQFDPSAMGAIDLDLWLRLLELGDLAVLDDVDCEVAIHSDQESHALFRNGSHAMSMFAILKRYQGSAAWSAFVSKAVRTYSGRCLWLGWKCLTEGHLRGAWQYWTLPAHHGVSTRRMLAGFLVHCWWRARSRLQTAPFHLRSVKASSPGATAVSP